MRVKAPPKWLIKPANKVAITQSTIINPLIPLDNSMMRMSNNPDSMIRFDCLASGNPTPVIRWKFLRMKRLSSNNLNVRTNNNGESSQIESVPILSSPQIHVLENGSLLIRSIDKTKFEGIYLCEVSNGVGKPLEAHATLTIYQIPQIQVKVIPHGNNDGSSNTGSHKLSPPPTAQDHDQVIQMAIRHHSQVSLSCTGTGTVPIYVGWFKNGHEINVYDTSSITSTSSFRLFESPGGTILSGKNHGKSSSSSSSMDKGKQFGERTTNLLLKHVGRSDTAQYVCLTRNSFGMTHRIIMLHVLEPPDAPQSLKAIEVGSRTVTLTWSIEY
ncbi:Immunoglobulin domain containing protein [Euroglyphus maynei]|uniref:Immunoglobulin domain containing protein n=1 Tax=Euroglyphus maynei TaxID=6958 RepID=A0A1Y3BBV7_EURMA|nr:Immunoglobulin domain containing protein [Euroglyphus maynei]